ARPLRGIRHHAHRVRAARPPGPPDRVRPGLLRCHHPPLGESERQHSDPRRRWSHLRRGRRLAAGGDDVSSRQLRARIDAIERRLLRPVTRDELLEVTAAMRAPIPSAPEAALEPVVQLPERWRPQRFHEGQAAAFHSDARFRAIECGRRSGKSEGRKREIVIRGLDPDWPLEDRFIVVGAPTQQQTMRLYWRDLLALVPPRYVRAVRKSEYTIELVTGTIIRCLGMDRPERAEGDPLDDLFLDEVADMRAEEVLEHLRPALDTADRPPGTLTAYGTTDMRSGDAFVKLCDEWRAEAERGDDRYSYHHWTSAGIVSPA